MNTPTLVIGYRRPDFLLEQINRLLLRNTREIFIDVATSRSENVGANTECLSIAQEYLAQYPSVIKILPQEFDKGAANSIILAVTRVLSVRDSVIVLEDDVRPSEDFFTFVTNVYMEFQTRESTWFICGNQRAPSDLLVGGYAYAPFLMPWGWVTTRDKWLDALRTLKMCIDQDLNLTGLIKSSRSATAMYRHSGLRSSWAGRLNAWDVPIWSAMETARSSAIFPPTNLVAHVGDDGRELHPPANGGLGNDRQVGQLPSVLHVAAPEDQEAMLDWYWKNVFRVKPWAVPIGWVRYAQDALLMKHRSVLDEALRKAIRILQP